MRSIPFWLFLLWSISAIGQPSSSFPSIRYGDGDGLGQTEIYGMAQDKNGYLLMGSNKGLLRFDGTTFKVVESPESLQSNIVERVLKWTRDSFLLVCSYPRRMFWYHKGKLSKFDLDIIIPGGSNFRRSPTDKSGLFWGRGKLISFNEHGYHMIDTLDPLRYMCTNIHAFSQDSALVSNEHTTYFQGKSRTELPGISYITNVLALEDSLLIFNQHSIYGLRNRQLTSRRALPSGASFIQHSLRDWKGNIWFSGRNRGLWIIQNGRIIDMTANLGLEKKQVTFLFLDNSGNVWISTSTAGLICVLQSRFTHYRITDGLNSDDITTINSWKGQIYVGTNAGLNVLAPDGIFNNTALDRVSACSANLQAAQGNIHSIFSTDDLLIVGSDAAKRLGNYCEPTGVLTHSFGSSIVLGDTILLCGWGVFKLSLRSNPTKKIWGLRTPKETGITKVFFLRKGRAKELLIGTPVGLFKIYSTLNKVVKVKTTSRLENAIFYDMEETPNGDFWFATSQGLARWSADGQWKILDSRHGLSTNHIRCLEVDTIGRIWLGSQSGIDLYSQEVFSNYSTGSGLISNSVNTLFFSKEQNMLWVGTDKGISKFDVSTIGKAVQASFPLYITDIEVVGDTTYQPIGLQDLDPSNANLRIHYASINYTNPTAVVYQYRLLPTSPKWIDTKENRAEFLSLGTGNYQFEVRSKTSGKTWGSSASISFNVAPPFWQTLEFIAGMALLFLIVSALVFWWRIQAIKRKEMNKRVLLQKINHLEQQAMSLSMSPHFIFNSLNSIQHFFSGTKNLAAIKYVSNFAKLIRLNMDSSKKRTISLNDEVRRLQLYLKLEKERFDKEFNYTISVSPELEDENPEIPNMVIQPLIENAIWHGILPSPNPGEIALEISKNQGMDIVVIDNGIGLTAAKKNARKNHKSQGLSLTQERLAYLSPQNFLKVEELLDNQGNTIGTRSFLHLERA